MINAHSLLLLGLAIISSFSISYLLIPILRKLSLDLPNNRSSHLKPIPSSGGISFFLISIISFIFFKRWVFLITIPIAIIGFLDDCIKIKPIYRFVVQLLTVIAFLIIDSDILSAMSGFNIFLNLLSVTFLVIFCIGIINFINFMDGLDGLVCGCMIIILSTFNFKYDHDFATLIGALIGFLILNWSPAKIFMGDIGSTFLGSIYVYILLQSLNIIDFLSLIALGTPLIFDSIICVIRRLINKQNIFAAHRSHLYQRLNKSGLSHQTVSKIYICSTIILSICYLTGQQSILFCGVFLIIVIGYILDVKIAIPFKKSLIID